MIRHFLADDDLTPAEQAEVLDLAAELKASPYDARPYAGPQSVAMVFDKPTLRTTDEFHPCQLLADLLTVREHEGALTGPTVAFVGDAADNLGNSWLLAGAVAGTDVRVAGPAGYRPSEAVFERATAIRARTGGSATGFADPVEAVQGADVVVTDTWVSMGKEAEVSEREALFAPYTLTVELLAQAQADAIVLHCLPAYRGKEIAAEVIDGPQSVVWDEAENRRHSQKAVLSFLMEHPA